MNPNFAHTWLELSGFLLKPHRWDEAVLDAKRALELEPASYFLNRHMAFISYMTGRLKESIDVMRKAQEFAPDPDQERRLVDCRIRELEMNYAEAIKCLQTLTAHDAPDAKSSLRLLFFTQSPAMKKKAESSSRKRYRNRIANKLNRIGSLRLLRLCTTMIDQAFTWLEKAYESRNPALPYVNSDPAFDNLRPDPRWTSLIKRMGLQP